MIKIHVGCSGWYYKDWKGPFYPKKLEPHHYLEHYAKFFDIVEINTSYYNLPSENTVEKWSTLHLPRKFRFAVKVWQKISHKLGDSDLEIESRIAQFFYRLKPLEGKISAFLFQFPPRFKFSVDNNHKLKFLLNQIPFEEGIKYIFELRDNSWFESNLLSNYMIGSERIFGTTYMPKLSPYYPSNQKYYYIRLIGDQVVTVFNRIQRKQEDAISDLKQKVQELMKKSNIFEIFIIVNNHFTGFAPEMANQIKKIFDLPLKKFNKQKNMFDFI